jgi:hypothetical protein
MLIRCNKCNGQKKTLGMGMMIKSCDKCNSVGFIDYPVVEEVKEQEEKKDGKENDLDGEAEVSPKIGRKRGRPASIS